MHHMHILGQTFDTGWPHWDVRATCEAGPVTILVLEVGPWRSSNVNQLPLDTPLADWDLKQHLASQSTLWVVYVRRKLETAHVCDCCPENPEVNPWCGSQRWLLPCLTQFAPFGGFTGGQPRPSPQRRITSKMGVMWSVRFCLLKDRTKEKPPHSRKVGVEDTIFSDQISWAELQATTEEYGRFPHGFWDVRIFLSLKQSLWKLP